MTIGFPRSMIACLLSAGTLCESMRDCSLILYMEGSLKPACLRITFTVRGKQASYSSSTAPANIR